MAFVRKRKQPNSPRLALSRSPGQTLFNLGGNLTMQPKFLALQREYVFVPVPSANVTFRNNVKVNEIDYPWVYVESVPQSGQPTPAPV